MHDSENSDSGIVVTKPTNKAGRPVAEPAGAKAGDQVRILSAKHPAELFPAPFLLVFWIGGEDEHKSDAARSVNLRRASF